MARHAAVRVQVAECHARLAGAVFRQRNRRASRWIAQQAVGDQARERDAFRRRQRERDRLDAEVACRRRRGGTAAVLPVRNLVAAREYRRRRRLLSGAFVCVRIPDVRREDGVVLGLLPHHARLDQLAVEAELLERLGADRELPASMSEVSICVREATPGSAASRHRRSTARRPACRAGRSRRSASESWSSYRPMQNTSRGRGPCPVRGNSAQHDRHRGRRRGRHHGRRRPRAAPHRAACCPRRSWCRPSTP